MKSSRTIFREADVRFSVPGSNIIWALCLTLSAWFYPTVRMGPQRLGHTGLHHSGEGLAHRQEHQHTLNPLFSPFAHIPTAWGSSLTHPMGELTSNCSKPSRHFQLAGQGMWCCSPALSWSRHVFLLVLREYCCHCWLEKWLEHLFWWKLVWSGHLRQVLHFLLNEPSGPCKKKK